MQRYGIKNGAANKTSLIVRNVRLLLRIEKNVSIITVETFYNIFVMVIYVAKNYSNILL